MQGLGLGSLRRKGKFFRESSIIFLYSKVYIHTHIHTCMCMWECPKRFRPIKCPRNTDTIIVVSKMDLMEEVVKEEQGSGVSLIRV